jgi:hypothetical protein
MSPVAVLTLTSSASSPFASVVIAVWADGLHSEREARGERRHHDLAS